MRCPGHLGRQPEQHDTRDGRAIAFGFAGDAGYWTIPAGPMDISFPDQLDWSAKLSFAPTLDDGPRDLAVAAVDATGRFGAPSLVTLRAEVQL
ncbi:MAG: hypothetical protein E6J90_35835 [Deltaproteobacteria bacterium]|nr:MAG: hypothetical protein E6J90_35835 [Deltaproteobacteria bacterium]